MIRFERKFGYSEVIALIAVGFSLYAIWQASSAREDARLISGLDLRPNISLRSDFKRIKISRKPDTKAIKEKAPYFLITNQGPIDAIQMEVQLFIHQYSQTTDKLGKTVTSSCYHWIIEQLPPLKSKTFTIDTWIYGQPAASPASWNSVLEIRLTYRRNPDMHEFSQSAYYFVGPQEFWVSEKDHSSLNTERYRPIVKAAIAQRLDFPRRRSDILHPRDNAN